MPVRPGPPVLLRLVSQPLLARLPAPASAPQEILAEMGGKPDLIIANYRRAGLPAGATGEVYA